LKTLIPNLKVISFKVQLTFAGVVGHLHGQHQDCDDDH